LPLTDFFIDRPMPSSVGPIFAPVFASLRLREQNFLVFSCVRVFPTFFLPFFPPTSPGKSLDYPLPNAKQVVAFSWHSISTRPDSAFVDVRSALPGLHGFLSFLLFPGRLLFCPPVPYCCAASACGGPCFPPIFSLSLSAD